jgi:hypothetical protein
MDACMHPYIHTEDLTAELEQRLHGENVTGEEIERLRFVLAHPADVIGVAQEPERLAALFRRFRARRTKLSKDLALNVLAQQPALYGAHSGDDDLAPRAKDEPPSVSSHHALEDERGAGRGVIAVRREHGVEVRQGMHLVRCLVVDLHDRGQHRVVHVAEERQCREQRVARGKEVLVHDDRAVEAQERRAQGERHRAVPLLVREGRAVESEDPQRGTPGDARNRSDLADVVVVKEERLQAEKPGKEVCVWQALDEV